MNINEFISELECMIRARYTAIYINTFEEERCFSIVKAMGKKLNMRIISWSFVDGLTLEEAGGKKQLDAKSLNFQTAVNMARTLAQEPTLFVWYDMHNCFKGNPVNVRAFKQLCQNLIPYQSNSLIISPIADIPVELQKEISIIDLPLPSINECVKIVKDFTDSYAGNSKLQISNDADTVMQLGRSSVGLSKHEIENCLSKSLVKNHAISKNEIKLILDEKKQIVRKAGILEYIDTTDFNMDKVGGLQNLKKWLEIRKTAFTKEAIDFGLDYPKGVLLVGIPGCGKSLSAKCVASAWNMPLLKLDMGKIFSGIVGSSEANMRQALSLCETVSPAILWIDEIEKGLSGSDSGGSDGGTSTRVFGNLLTWMQEKKSPVFVFATANNIENLPPELLRKGRFDEIFFIDFPSEEERREIFTIMINGCKRDPGKFDIDKFVELSGEAAQGENIRFTGSEIEAVVKDALLRAFYRHSVEKQNIDMNTDDVIKAMGKIVPLAKSRADSIKKIRDWASENAVSASIAAPTKIVTNVTSKEVSSGRNITF